MAIGRKTGGGSRKGRPNKRTLARKEAIAASGLSPLDYMLAVMRDENNEMHVRLEAAGKAAPYVHPRLGTMTVKGDEDAPLHTVSRIELVPVEPKRIE